MARGQITADITVKVTQGVDGAYKFEYSGQFAQPNGDLNFAAGVARKNAVKIVFGIANGSIDGIQFKSNNNANDGPYWIVEKSKVGADGCPQGPYMGDQFSGIATTAGGRQMHVINKNDDGKKYRYMLRFDLNGVTVVHDPDNDNGKG
ncbi:MAG: hypothetical protein R3C60_13940 [Parvularculaceae bacterium]